MTEDRQVRRLALVDFPSPPVVAGRMRVPKHFSPKEPASRRNLAAAFRSRLAEIDLGAASLRRPPADAEVAARVEDLRDQQRRDPCHGCPDREQHARAAERALRLERENARVEARASTRTHTIATAFDRICLVLESLGYLAGRGRDVAARAGHRRGPDAGADLRRARPRRGRVHPGRRLRRAHRAAAGGGAQLASSSRPAAATTTPGVRGCPTPPRATR